MSPYLLTVMSAANTVFVTAMIVATTVAGVSAIVFMASSSSYQKEDRALALTLLKKSLSVLSVAALAYCFVPSQTALREAYIMTEVAKIATADNAKATAEVLLQRIDKLLELKQSNSK